MLECIIRALFGLVIHLMTPLPPKKNKTHNEPNASLFLGHRTSHNSLQDYDTAREVLRGAISKGNPGDAIDDFQKMKVQRPQEKVTLAPL